MKKSTDHEIARDSKGKFVAGKGSPNPGGKPSTASLVRYIRDNTNDFQDIVDRLIDIINGTKYSPANRIRAMEVLFDRGLGKPHQSQSIGLAHKINTPLEELLDKIDNG
jgi:hypothetical protein